MTKARSNATANAAKGDLTVGNGTNLSGVLAVGSNGDTIVADSSTSTGLRYQASTAAGRNFLINGGMDIAQRGTTFTSVANVYTLDRWYFEPYGSATSANISQGSSDSVTGFRYYAKVAANSATSSNFNFGQTIETANTVPLRGKTVTVSFYLRTPVAFSNVFTWELRYSTSTDTRISNAGAGTLVGASSGFTPTSTWTRYSQTYTIPTDASSLAFILGTYNNTVSTANFDITGVQLEIGSVATTFSRAGGTIQGELAACQRYYYRVTPTAAGSRLGVGYATTTGATNILMTFPVTMRTAPTALEQSGTASDYSIAYAATSAVCNAVPVLNIADNTCGSYNFATATALVVGNGVIGRAVNTSAYIGWSAEL